MQAIPPPVALPPPGPALTLHQAAAKLRAAAEAARAGGRTPTPAEWYALMDNVLGGPVGVLCGLLSPGLALVIADHLDATAVEAVRHAAGFGNIQEEITDGYPMTMATRRGLGLVAGLVGGHWGPSWLSRLRASRSRRSSRISPMRAAQ